MQTWQDYKALLMAWEGNPIAARITCNVLILQWLMECKYSRNLTNATDGVANTKLIN